MKRPRRDADDFWPMFLGMGQAQQMASPDEEPPKVAATLWVPDPEQRHGFREYYVRKPGAESPPDRPLGFRKPGS